nr:uncharacterized protein LOC109155154 [Ipomoea batatas]
MDCKIVLETITSSPGDRESFAQYDVSQAAGISPRKTSRTRFNFERGQAYLAAGAGAVALLWEDDRLSRLRILFIQVRQNALSRACIRSLISYLDASQRTLREYGISSLYRHYHLFKYQKNPLHLRSVEHGNLFASPVDILKHRIPGPHATPRRARPSPGSIDLHITACQYPGESCQPIQPSMQRSHFWPATRSGGWINLPQGGLKLNVDAANDKNSLNTGFGFILLDSDGHLVAVMEGNWKGFLHAKMAEAIAVREALKWLKTLGLTIYEIFKLVLVAPWLKDFLAGTPGPLQAPKLSDCTRQVYNQKQKHSLKIRKIRIEIDLQKWLQLLLHPDSPCVDETKEIDQ